MINDLSGPLNMSIIVGMLFAAVKENNERLRLITMDMSQEELDYKGPGNKYNSTAQLIRHLTFVDLNWAYRIIDVPLPYQLKERFGTMIDENNKLPMIEGKSLDQLLSDYNDFILLLGESCIRLTDSDLERVVHFGHQNEKKATIRWGLWHIADHSRYHQAHINLLRKWYKENFSS